MLIWALTHFLWKKKKRHKASVYNGMIGQAPEITIRLSSKTKRHSVRKENISKTETQSHCIVWEKKDHFMHPK